MNVRLNEDQKIQILNASDVYKIMQQILLRQNKIRRSQEYFWVVGLDNQNNVLFVELISIGGANRVNVSPPDVFRMGIYKLALKMILIHNHPSGVLRPSEGDKNFTDRLLKVGKIIDIKVIEHLIITETDYYSFANEGLIKEFENNGLYELVRKESEEMKAFKLKLEKKENEKNKAIEIAKRLKGLGQDNDFIKKATGLTKRDIDKI
ncbi:JAB domain-containing protein [uncultured Dokdonia sp.]|uniref:JAB domain-containing protein n=1 Tax=uncultured Dokdonia sp. TaxID=575653 RepID=UPI002624B760|nr:JAB domain-containing protein [uncultured Dokdonia sp.]